MLKESLDSPLGPGSALTAAGSGAGTGTGGDAGAGADSDIGAGPGTLFRAALLAWLLAPPPVTPTPDGTPAAPGCPAAAPAGPEPLPAGALRPAAPAPGAPEAAE